MGVVEEGNVDDLADKDEAEEEGGRAEDDGLEEGHGEERSAEGPRLGFVVRVSGSFE